MIDSYIKHNMQHPYPPPQNKALDIIFRFHKLHQHLFQIKRAIKIDLNPPSDFDLHVFQH